MRGFNRDAPNACSTVLRSHERASPSWTNQYPECAFFAPILVAAIPNVVSKSYKRSVGRVQVVWVYLTPPHLSLNVEFLLGGSSGGG